MSDCIFCRIVNFLEPSDRMPLVLRDWTDATAFVPLDPVVPGHVLIVPKVHVEDASIDPVVSGVVFKRAAEWAQTRVDDFNLITSAGVDATQTVRHLHAHYVPRVAGDGLALPWTGQAERLADEQEAINRLTGPHPDCPVQGAHEAHLGQRYRDDGDGLRTAEPVACHGRH